MVDDARLSREHARFTWVAGGLIVDDLGSRNGTWVAGERITSIHLSIGAEVRLGRTLVRVCATSALERAGQPASAAGASAAACGASGEREGSVRRAGAPSRAPSEEGSSAHRSELIAGPKMRELLGLVDRVAPSRVPVLLHGETGTGKERLARRLHEASLQKAGALVCVNCGAIPEHLVESTLFGHERGAFTGAVQQRKGVFEEADGGTVFLDEIGELPHSIQVALLRVLETGSFCRVGGAREVRTSVRIIAATHRDLKALVGSGGFRADLFYRLNTVTLKVPPLRERPEDITPLALHFLKEANEANGRAVRGIAPQALAALERHTWPGNVRELRNAIEHAVVVTRSEKIEAADLPRNVGSQAHEPAESAPDDRTTAPPGDEDLRAQMQRYEAQLIVEALRASGGRRAAAASRLGIPLRTLAHRIKALGIQEASNDDAIE
jgi:DNA-binding NtrC family response regulator